MTCSFCKDHQSTDLQNNMGTACKAATSLCSAALKLQMGILLSLENNSLSLMSLPFPERVILPIWYRVRNASNKSQKTFRDMIYISVYLEHFNWMIKRLQRWQIHPENIQSRDQITVQKGQSSVFLLHELKQNPTVHLRSFEGIVKKTFGIQRE